MGGILDACKTNEPSETPEVCHVLIQLEISQETKDPIKPAATPESGECLLQDSSP